MHSGRAIGRWAALAATAALLTCQEGTRPSAPASEASLVTVTYVCGRNFDLENANAAGITAHFEIEGTGEAGDLSLPPAAPDSTPSRTRLTTVTSGAVTVAVDEGVAGTADNTGAACPPDPARPEPQATTGEWSAPFDWPVVAVHLHLLPDGRVLSWGRIGEPQVWDPATGIFTEVPSATDLFCAGHAFLADGRLLVAGGHIDQNRGLPDANLFDFSSTSWIRVASMAKGRWYPTVTELPDGRMIALAGRDQTGAESSIPEIWDGAAWSPLQAGDRVLPYYPRTFVAPNGKVFYAGELRQSRYLDPVSGAWEPVAETLYGRREYGSAVMYRPGMVLIVGGSDPPGGLPTSSAEVIDLGEAMPAWHFTGSMAFARRQFNATQLPDGRIVATGGTSASGFSDPSGAVHAAEMWDPSSGQWTTWASNAVTRVYHSTTLLLPDGRLLHAGSGDGAYLPRELNAELFSPPYLFHGPRPRIDSSPSSVGYGAAFDVESADAGTIVQASLVRLSSVTHAFDQNQRFIPLSFVRSAGGLTISAPQRSTVAPPGHYMLFVLNGDGTPSVSRILQLH